MKKIRNLVLMPFLLLFLFALHVKADTFFDAWDVLKDIDQRTISTKKVSQNFDLSIVALNETNDALQDYNGTVQARIVYATGCPSGDENLTDYKDVNLSNQKEDITFNVAKAVKDARVQIKTDDNTTCSSNNFAIRPEKFYFTLPSQIRAGEDFNITFKADNAVDYNEIRGISFEVNATEINSTCKTGSFNLNDFNFTNGEAIDINASYSEVGKINVT